MFVVDVSIIYKFVRYLDGVIFFVCLFLRIKGKDREVFFWGLNSVRFEGGRLGYRFSIERWILSGRGVRVFFYLCMCVFL